MKILTIGVPTYKNIEVTLSLIRKLSHLISLYDNVEILIIDDASNQNFVEEISKNITFSNQLRFFENKYNLGLAGNIAQLFRMAEGKYLLLLSDEDELIIKNIPKLLEYLISKKPVFLSTQFIRNTGYGDFVYRGRMNSNKILISDFHSASFYISGLIFSVEHSRSIINKIEKQKESYTSAFIYPQCLLTAILLLKYDNSYWFPYPITQQVHDTPPRVSMNDSSKYNYIENRWKQYLGFIVYFEDFIKDNELNKNEKKLVNQLLKTHKDKLFYWIRWGISTTNGQYMKHFDKGALIFSLNNIFISLKYIFYYIFNKNKYVMEKNYSVPTKATLCITRLRKIL